MNINRIASLIALAAIAATTGYPQTAGELLQKGIYTQETAGDLDGAIAVYRQIVNSGSSPRDVAAQAQYRLAQSLLQKGDLGNAATEFSNLARNYADYGRLVSSMASMARKTVAVAGGGGRGGRGGPAAPQLAADIAKLQAQLAAVAGDPAQVAEDVAKLQAQLVAVAGEPSKTAEVDQAKANLQAALAELQARRARTEAESEGGGRVAVAAAIAGLFDGISFNGGSPLTVKGTVVELLMLSPTSVVYIDPQDGSGKSYAFELGSPVWLNRQGWTRQSVKAGDQLTVMGVLASGGQTVRPGVYIASATTVTAADGHKLFDRAESGK